MKRYILSLIAVLFSIIGYCAVVEVNIGDQSTESNAFYMSFDWFDESHTSLKTADAVVEFTITDRYEQRGDGCLNHIHEAKVTGSSPHRGGPGWILGSSNYGIPAEVEVDGVKYPVVAIGDFSFAFGPGDLGYKLPESIKYIGKGAFFNNTPQGIDYNKFIEIGDYAFYGNKVNGDIKLTNVEKLGKYAFANCGFSRISINGPLKEIGEGAFYNITSNGIVSIYIGDNVEIIGDHAFDACTSMGNWGNTTPEGNSALYIGKSVKYIGNFAFHEIRNLSQELIIPDATTYIGDYAFCHCFKFCPITLGKNVEYIGAYAFYKADHMCSNTLEIPASVKKIGPMAFDFTRHAEASRTNGLTDLWVHSQTPPELPTDENGMCAFGDIDVNLHFWDIDGWWFFPFVCLHIPQGSYLDYANHPYWGKFSCIIDDLTPDDPEIDHNDPDDALSYILGYVYLIPGESVNLEKDVLYSISDDLEYNWHYRTNINGEDCIFILDEKSDKVTAKTFGTDMAIAYRPGQQVWDGNKWIDVDETAAGVVIVFVCPTMTVVYDKNDITSPTLKTLALNDVSEISKLKSDNFTYTHRMPYDSYPKYEITQATPNIEIQVIERAKVDEFDNYLDNNNYDISDTTLQPIQDEQKVDGTYVVPLNPLEENRVAVLTLVKVNRNLSGIDDTDSDNNITIATYGNILTIIGADDADIITVINMQGQFVYKGINKTIELQSTGVYLIKVKDIIFKAIVH